jgi:hypothetical protein
MVKIEQPKKWKPELETAKVIALKRHAAGNWVAQVVVRLRVHLPDGRAIYGLHIVPIRCNQLGRKTSKRKVRRVSTRSKT